MIKLELSKPDRLCWEFVGGQYAFSCSVLPTLGQMKISMYSNISNECCPDRPFKYRSSLCCPKGWNPSINSNWSFSKNPGILIILFLHLNLVMQLIFRGVLWLMLGTTVMCWLVHMQHLHWVRSILETEFKTILNLTCILPEGPVQHCPSCKLIAVCCIRCGVRGYRDIHRNS